MSRTNPIKRKESKSVIIETYEDGDQKDVFAAAMLKSETLMTFGNEAQASLSRVNPEYGSAGPAKNEGVKYFHIQNAANPYTGEGGGIGSHQAILLCQKAFYNFPSFRNPIVMQSYLCNSPLHISCKDSKVKMFFETWAKQTQIWDVANQFFLEWFRSGNLFIYRFEGEMKLKDLKKISGAKVAEARSRKLPLKYTIINPADIRGLGSSSFADQTYGKVLNAYEVACLKNPVTDADKEIYNSLDADAKAAINNGQVPIIKLNPERLRVAFNAKQSYEPMAVPPYFGVLESINFKQILRSAETKVATSADYCILLVTAGEKDGGKRNQKVIEGLANLFSAQSVGRVLFADYTAKAEFVIPDFTKIFGKEKYENVDQDIVNGMNDIMAKQENFASGQTKTKIYLQLLDQARESFLNFFLLPELEKIAEEMGFSEVPTASFEEVTLDSAGENKKLYNRLYELGLLTAEELLHAYDSDQLPTGEESEKNQREFLAQKKAGLYEPIVGGKPSAEPGRPAGTKAPKTVTTVAPKGGKASLEKIKENLPKMNELADKINTHFKQKNGIARLSKRNKDLTEAIWERIVVNETPDNWSSDTVAKYIADPFYNSDSEQGHKIYEVMEEFQLGGLTEAAILFHAMKN